MDAKSVAGGIVIIFNFIVFFYFVAINTVYLVLFAAAFVDSMKYNRRRRFVDLYEVFRSPLTPSISVLVPAYNEQATIVDAVRSILLLRYPHFEVIVINDGSTDRTLELLGEKYNLRRVAKVVEPSVVCEQIRGVYISPDYENLVVVDKENGGKADALNAGINVSRHDLVCVIDADSLIEPEGLLKVARPFIENPTTTIAVGGLVRLVNGCTVEGGTVTEVRLPKNYLANLQTVEYLRAFLGGRIGWSALRSLLIVSGAFGLFDRRLAIEIDGYRRDTVGEDMDLVVRLHHYLKKQKREYRIFFVPDPVCWTEAPEKYRQLAKQRDRWQRGLIETLTSNVGMLLNPRYGSIGLFAMPYFFFFEMIGPVIEVTGYVAIVLALVLGLLNVQFLWLFISLAFFYAIAVSMFAVLLEGIALQHYPRVPALLKLAFYSIMENIGYRQVYAWWRTKAFFTLYTRKQTWGAMQRRGYEEGAEWETAAAGPSVAAGGAGAKRGRGWLIPVIATVVAVILVAVGVAAVVSVTRVDRSERTAPMAVVGGVDMAARAHGRYFDVYDGKGWNKYVVKGVNVGIALPGKWFSEFPADEKLYRSWFEEIAALNANTIRVYTLLDPVFYRTFYDFNRETGNRLMLLQEIWPDDEIPGNNLFDQGFTSSYRKEIEMDLQALAGRKNIPERKGRAWGEYDADVTPYVLGVIIGREIVYEEASTTNSMNPEKNAFAGRFVSAIPGARPVETWMAETCDYTVQCMNAGGWAAPVAFVSWPTLDPMIHPTEATPGVPKSEEQEDSEALDPNHIKPEQTASAGLFGCYHIYPYYPDFMNREPGYAEYRDEQGVLRYGGYLRQFISIHPEYPALMGEFGMSTSMGIAHVHPEGFSHGGVDEKQQGRLVARMYRSILREGYAGGAIFEWADEWSKRTWVDMDYMIPFDRHIYWHNMMDPEQNFGLMAYVPDRATGKNAVSYWESEKKKGSASTGGEIKGIRVNHDEGFTYLEIDLAASLAGQLSPGANSDFELDVGMDTIGKDSGTRKLPIEGLPELPGGVEFLLKLSAKDGGLLLAVPDYNRGTTKFMANPSTSPEFVHIQLLVNREQLNTLDGSVIPGEYTDDSILHYGNYNPAAKDYYSLAHWYVSGDTVHVRLPWMLLNVSDPSSLTVIHDDRTDLPEGPAAVRSEMGIDALRTQKTAGFSFYAVTTRAGRRSDFAPRNGEAWASVERFKWSPWDKPTYTERLKQSYPEIRKLYEE